jgi:hypothetical protein
MCHDGCGLGDECNVDLLAADAAVKGDVGSLKFDLVSAKCDVGSLKVDIVAVKGDIVSPPSEMVSMEARHLTTIDHQQTCSAERAPSRSTHICAHDRSRQCPEQLANMAWQLPHSSSRAGELQPGQCPRGLVVQLLQHRGVAVMSRGATSACRRSWLAMSLVACLACLACKSTYAPVVDDTIREIGHARVEGFVVSASGSPVAGAAVGFLPNSALSPAYEPATTGGDGSFVLQVRRTQGKGPTTFPDTLQLTINVSSGARLLGSLAARLAFDTLSRPAPTTVVRLLVSP